MGDRMSQAHLLCQATDDSCYVNHSVIDYLIMQGGLIAKDQLIHQLFIENSAQPFATHLSAVALPKQDEQHAISECEFTTYQGSYQGKKLMFSDLKHANISTDTLEFCLRHLKDRTDLFPELVLFPMSRSNNPDGSGGKHAMLLVAEANASSNKVHFYLFDSKPNEEEEPSDVKNLIAKVYPDASFEYNKTALQPNEHDCGPFVIWVFNQCLKNFSEVKKHFNNTTLQQFLHKETSYPTIRAQGRMLFQNFNSKGFVSDDLFAIMKAQHEARTDTRIGYQKTYSKEAVRVSCKESTTKEAVSTPKTAPTSAPRKKPSPNPTVSPLPSSSSNRNLNFAIHVGLWIGSLGLIILGALTKTTSGALASSLASFAIPLMIFGACLLSVSAALALVQWSRQSQSQFESCGSDPAFKFILGAESTLEDPCRITHMQVHTLKTLTTLGIPASREETDTKQNTNQAELAPDITPE